MRTEKLDFSNLRRLGEHFLRFQASAPHPAPCYKKLDVFPINLSQKVFLCSDDLLCRRPFRTIVPQDLHQLRTNLPQNLHHSQSVMHKFTPRFALFVVRYAPIYPKICISYAQIASFVVSYVQIYPRFALFVVRYAPIFPKICTVTVDYAPIYPKICIIRSQIRTNLPQDLHQLRTNCIIRSQLRTNLPQICIIRSQIRTNLPQNLHPSQSVTHKFTPRFALFVVRNAPIYPKICTVTVDYAPIYPKIYINRSPLCTSFTPRFVGLGSS